MHNEKEEGRLEEGIEGEKDGERRRERFREIDGEDVERRKGKERKKD